VSREAGPLIERQVPVRDDSDVAMVRKQAREIGRSVGLREPSIEALATAISEVARNIVVHAGSGEVAIRVESSPSGPAIIAVARDQGPGIADMHRAMQDGYSTGGSLGLGLPSARRLVDEFEIVSAPDQGTTVTLTVWVRGRVGS
jgi:serine/threonine-protein kinase RsbT